MMLILGDSLLCGFSLLREHTVVCFPGWTLERARDDLFGRLMPRVLECDFVVLHVGTNDLARDGGAMVARRLVQLGQDLEEASGKRVVVSSPVVRKDGLLLHLHALRCSEDLLALGSRQVWVHRKVRPVHLSRDGLHLTSRGRAVFRASLVGHLRSFPGRRSRRRRRIARAE
jgi:hypothetical protein